MESIRQFFYEFMMTYRLFLNELNGLLEKYQLHRSQWAVLDIIHHSGSVTLVEISKHQRVEKPTITRTVSRLEELGLVEHIPGKDKREKRMVLTEEGLQLFNEIRLDLDNLERQHLDGVSSEEILAVTRTLGMVRENINKGKKG